MREPSLISIPDVDFLRTEEDPVRKLVSLVLLLGVKDGASKVRFEPDATECRMYERVNGTDYELVPAPVPGSQVIDSIRALTRLDRYWFRRTWECPVRLNIGGSEIAAHLSLLRTEHGEMAI